MSPKSHYPQMMSANQSLQDNGVNEAGVLDDESPSPGRCSTAMQRGPGRHYATAVDQSEESGLRKRTEW